jgi:hypothetical protein
MSSGRIGIRFSGKLLARVVGLAISMVTSSPRRGAAQTSIPLSFRIAKEAFHYRSRPYIRAHHAVKVQRAAHLLA